jgi:hypothetical protein
MSRACQALCGAHQQWHPLISNLQEPRAHKIPASPMAGLPAREVFALPQPPVQKWAAAPCG